MGSEMCIRDRSWIPWYWMIKFPSDSEHSGYSWGLYMIFQMYYSTFAQAMAAIAPNAMIASVLFSTFFAFVVVLCGVVQPPSELPTFWRSWMFPLSPFTWVMEGILGNAVGGAKVECLDKEMQTLHPPDGQTCEGYMRNFPLGYATSKDGDCKYCLYDMGDQYLESIRYNYHHKYRDLGIMAAYIAFNIILLFGLLSLIHI